MRDDLNLFEGCGEDGAARVFIMEKGMNKAEVWSGGGKQHEKIEQYEERKSESEEM